MRLPTTKCTKYLLYLIFQKVAKIKTKLKKKRQTKVKRLKKLVPRMKIV